MTSVTFDRARPTLADALVQNRSLATDATRARATPTTSHARASSTPVASAR
jgi:hypothetical protein